MKKMYKNVTEGITEATKIEIPLNVKISKVENTLIFSGPLGRSKLNIKKLDQKGNIGIKIKENTIEIITQVNQRSQVSFNSCNSLIKNKINGVTQGYIVYLRLVGIGYRCSLENDVVTFKIGYSHDVRYKVPTSIRIFLIEPTLLSIFGVDKNQVNQIAAQIRHIKPPSPYKGKGIRLLQEQVRLKQGKQK